MALPDGCFRNWPVEMTIGGHPVKGDGEPIRTIDPATEELLTEIPTATGEQLDAAVAAAREAQVAWAARTPAERSAAMLAFCDALEARSGDLVDTIVADGGTPVATSRFVQVALALEHLRWYATAAAQDWTVELGPRLGALPAASTINYLPVGVVGAIPAYNFPMFLTISKVGASMAAGCSSVVLTPPLTPLMVLLFGEISREAGLPPGLLNVLAGGPDIGRLMSTHPGIDKVAFTGSETVGAQVMAQAAQSIKGVVLELGGKSPNLLLPDVDLEAEMTSIHRGYSATGGQVCGATSRILVHRSRYDELVDLSREFYEGGFGAWDPWEEDAVVGPLITGAHRERVERAVVRAVDEGAEVLAGGGRPDMPCGYYLNPVLLGGTESGAWIAQEEVFGPVAVVLAYDDEDEAVQLANDTRYGLNARIAGGDLAHCLELARRIRSGTVMINGGGILRPDSVFGGMKHSGVGREYGLTGIHEYLEPQHVLWGLATSQLPMA